MVRTVTPTLAEFLLARIAEQEAVARAVPVGEINVPPAHWSVSGHPPDAGKVLMGTAVDFALPSPEVAAHVARHDPAHVLAQCEAHRRIIDAYRASTQLPEQGHHNLIGGAIQGTYETVLRELAAAYDKHPDYDRSWRP